MELDRVLWRENHVEIRQLIDDFARYLYLPRLQQSAVVSGAVRDGLALLTWEQDSFAFADSFNEAEGRYLGLRGGQQVTIEDTDPPGLLVKSDIARQQMNAEVPKPHGDDASITPVPPGKDEGSPPSPSPPVDKKPKRFYGSVALDSTRVGRNASRIAEEVLSHLSGLMGAKVKVSLEVEAEMPDGAPENVVRTVTENSQMLKFTSLGFEKE